MKLQTRRIMVTVVSHCWIFKPWRVCWKAKRTDRNQVNHIASSSTKEDKEVIKQKQLAYLKEHEQEMTAYVKAHNANIASGVL